MCVIITITVVENDHCWSKIVKLCCCHGYYVMLQIYEDVNDPNVSIVVMVTKL